MSDFWCFWLVGAALTLGVITEPHKGGETTGYLLFVTLLEVGLCLFGWPLVLGTHIGRFMRRRG